MLRWKTDIKYRQTHYLLRQQSAALYLFPEAFEADLASNTSAGKVNPLSELLISKIFPSRHTHRLQHPGTLAARASVSSSWCPATKCARGLVCHALEISTPRLAAGSSPATFEEVPAALLALRLPVRPLPDARPHRAFQTINVC